MRSATPNHHVPRYPPISSPLSALCHFEEGQMNPGRVLFWVCVYLGRFHCGELFYEQAFMGIQNFSRVCCRRKSKKGLVPSSKASATNIWSDNKRQRRLSHHNPSAGITLGSCSKMASANETQAAAQKHKSRQKTVEFYKLECWELLQQNDFLLMRSLFLK